MTAEETNNRRDSSRVAAVFRVNYSSLDKLVSAYTENISKGGIYIKTPNLLPLNTMVRIKLIMPDTAEEVTCIGQVARVHGPQGNPNIPTGMAIVFRDMTRENMDRIESCIAELTLRDADATTTHHIYRKLNVLVVDDDKMLRERAANIFREKGHDVTTAEDGLKGLAACLKNPPDVILTDVQMPKMDGWNFLKTIRARPSLASTLVIFQTSLNSEKDRLFGYQLGVDDYVAKPYNAEELLARVDRLIARSKSHQSAQKSKALRGDIDQVSIPTILSLLEIEKKTGVVVVVSGTICRLYIMDGRPLSIEMDNAPNVPQLELVRRLFSWTTGQFEFAPQDVPNVDRIQLSMQGLLLEVARIADEATR